MGTVSPSPPSSRPGVPDFGSILRFWDSIGFALPNSSVLLHPLQALDRNGTVNWGKVVFLASCFATMAGCGILTSLLRRKDEKRISEIRRQRRSLRKNRSKSSTGTVTSSEDEDDSTESVYHSNVELSEQPDQSDDGSFSTIHPATCLY